LLQPISTGQAAEEFVVGDEVASACGQVHLVAFRTTEAAQNANLNATSNGAPTGDADLADRVMQVYDLATGTLVNTGQAVLPCTFDACDPRAPYKVSGSVVKFLTREIDQGGLDLDGNGSNNGLVLQSFDFCSGRTITIGPVDPDGGGQNPLDEDAAFTVDAGRCGLPSPTSCSNDAACGDAGAFCDVDACNTSTGKCVFRTAVTCTTDSQCRRCVLRQPSACSTTSECPGTSTCVASRVTA